MTDDEEWYVDPSGLEVKGKHHPRIVDGVDTLTGERLDPEELTLQQAEARSVEHRRQRARSIFTDPIWPADRVVSWIGYRDVDAIEESFAPALYKDSRPVVEDMPRIALLRALQEGRLRALRQQGKLVDRIHPDEWAYVQRGWSIDRWHECLFARSDVIALWPEVKRPALIESGAEVAAAPLPAAPPEPAAVSQPTPKVAESTDEIGAAEQDIAVKTTETLARERSERIKSTAENLEPGFDKRRQDKREYPFRDEMVKRLGFPLTTEEIDKAWSSYPHGGKPGKRSRKPSS